MGRLLPDPGRGVSTRPGAFRPVRVGGRQDSRADRQRVVALRVAHLTGLGAPGERAMGRGPQGLGGKHRPGALEARRARGRAEPLFLARTSNAQLECGDIASALATAQQAVGAARRLGSRNWGIDALCMLSRALREAEGRAARSRAEELLEEGRVWLVESGARVYAPVIEEEHARWAALLGDDEGHRRHLHEAHRLYERNGAHGHTERLAGELGL
jgi:hypothetical protein